MIKTVGFIRHVQKKCFPKAAFWKMENNTALLKNTTILHICLHLNSAVFFLYIRHLETCNIAGDQYMYILCCLFVTLYKLLFLLRVGLIYNMLDDLSFTSYLLYFFKCTQMILVFHRKSSFFFSRYSNL